jgi:Tfx family DNA-binding protein
MNGRTLFTARQLQVIALQRKGMRKSLIARTLGTSLQNVSMIDRRIREKTALARNTLAFVDSGARLRMSARKGERVLRLAERVFALADAKGIKVRARSMEILGMLEAAGVAKNGKITRNTVLVLLSDGSTSIA